MSKKKTEEVTTYVRFEWSTPLKLLPLTSAVLFLLDNGKPVIHIQIDDGEDGKLAIEQLCFIGGETEGFNIHKLSNYVYYIYILIDVIEL